MKNNNTLFVKRLSFIIILAILGTACLFAQRSGGTGKSEPDTNVQKEISDIKDNLSSMENRLNGEIDNVKKDIDNLQEVIKKKTDDAADNYKKLFEKTSKVYFFQMISAISVALIAVLILGAFVFFLLIKVFHIIPDKPEAKKDAAPGAESKNVISDLVEEINSLKYKFENIQSQLRQFSDKTDLQSGETSRFKDNLSSIRTEMEDNKLKIKNMEAVISSIKNDIDKDKEKNTRKEETERDPVAVFNKWSQNPGPSLPPFFTYVTITTKPETRTNLVFNNSVLETDWIRNTVGENKCLFPNPKKIDNLSGPVDDLYKVVGTRKGLGANSVKITKACQIKDGNFIEYKGELMLN
jgi:predicted nuclease with TOPRIM domain